MGSFLQSFICEAHNLASAQVIASGGQALINYQIRQCVILENPHKNQVIFIINSHITISYIFITIGAVFIECLWKCCPV